MIFYLKIVLIVVPQVETLEYLKLVFLYLFLYNTSLQNCQTVQDKRNFL